jgi:hypothetical protein
VPSIAHWTFDEGSGQTAADSSGYSRDATLGSTTGADDNDPSWVTCTVGGSALEFDGVDDYIEDPDGEAYINGLTAFTVSAWIKSDVTGTDRGFIHTMVPNSSDSVLGIRYDAIGSQGAGTNVIKVGISVDGTNQLLESSDNIQTTNWQHVTVTWSSGNQLALYLDGSLDTPLYNEAGVAGSLSDATTLFMGLGGKDNVAGGWDGLIDQVRLYDRVLTAAEISTLASSPPTGCGTAAVSGTITASATESDIVAGGRTLVITLTNDTWDATIGANNAATTALINGLDSNGVEAAGWDAVVKANLTFNDVVRTSDTVVTITLPAEAGYDITAAETITVTVPATAVSGGAAILARPAFNVQVVSATLTGTIMPSATSAEIVTGGKTLVITLTNDTWDATIGASNAATTALINGVQS